MSRPPDLRLVTARSPTRRPELVSRINVGSSGMADDSSRREKSEPSSRYEMPHAFATLRSTAGNVICTRCYHCLFPTELREPTKVQYPRSNPYVG